MLAAHLALRNLGQICFGSFCQDFQYQCTEYVHLLCTHCQHICMLFICTQHSIKSLLCIYHAPLKQYDHVLIDRRQYVNKTPSYSSASRQQCYLSLSLARFRMLCSKVHLDFRGVLLHCHCCVYGSRQCDASTGTCVFRWVCTWLMQLHPLFGPILHNSTIMAMQTLWNKVCHTARFIKYVLHWYLIKLHSLSCVQVISHALL